MDIALMSMAMGQANVMQQASISVMKMSMNQATSQNMLLIQQMQTENLQHAAQPHLGGSIDLKI